MICYQMVPAGSSSRIKAPIRKDLNPLLFWTRSYERATKWIFKPFEGFLVFVSNYLPFFICRSIFFYCFPFWRRGSTNLSKLDIKIITRTQVIDMQSLSNKKTLSTHVWIISKWHFSLFSSYWDEMEKNSHMSWKAPPANKFCYPSQIFGHFGHIQFLKMPGFRQ